jgi:hypothetical protein
MMPLKVTEVGDLPYGLDAGDTEPGVLLRGGRTSVRLVARMLLEEVAVVPLAEYGDLRATVDQIRRAVGMPEGTTTEQIATAVEQMAVLFAGAR